VTSGSKTEYHVEVSNPAKKDLKGLSHETQIRIMPALKLLAVQPRPDGVKKLKGSGSYRIRCGDYRIVYDIDDKALRVTVLVVRHRSVAYR
jgi:mRNA interferase RelE/StbE